MSERENFADRFDNHVITFRSEYLHPDNNNNPVAVEILHYRVKGRTTMLALEYTLTQGRHLFVSGDFGRAAYSWGDKIDLEWIAHTDFGYFHGKCKASSEGDNFCIWNGDIALERVTDKVENLDWSKGKKEKFFRYAPAEIKYQRTWRHWLACHGHKFFSDMGLYDANGLTRMEKIGLVPHDWSVIHHQGLKSAFNIK